MATTITIRATNRDVVSVGIRVTVTVPDDVRGKDPIALYLFDENDRPLCHCLVEGKSARVDLPNG